MSEHIVIFTTLPDTEAAERLAEQLLDHKLAGCINILPQMTSMYRWQGKLEKGREHLLMIKTQAKRREAVTEFIHRQHPYELPEIIVLPVTGGLPAYLSWISDCTE
jgi:periplasmic divalent cation tolerance protein